MAILSKGIATKLAILDQARLILNAKGIGLTLDSLAKEMNTSKSRISNHFATKDALFIAILKKYEEELAEGVVHFKSMKPEDSFQNYVHLLSAVMDIQYKFRCGIIYLNMLSSSQHELKVHTEQNYSRNLLAIRFRIEKMHKQNLVVADLLIEPAWSAFVFVYVNLMTQWVIHLDMYDYKKSYLENKSIYLRGILSHLYLPFLTRKGKDAFKKLVFL